VLILHSNQRPTPGQVIIDETLRTVVAREYKAPVLIFSEYLDDEWTSLQSYGLAQADFLREKYARRDIRVIVADALPALRFVTGFRDRLFPGVPIVFLAVAGDRVDRTALQLSIVGILEDHDPMPTLQLALRLHPDARRLVFIRGAGEADRLWDKRVQGAVEQLESGLQIEYLSGLSTEDVLRRVGMLPRDAIVFTPGYFVDGAGEISTPRSSVERIAQASSVPVYGTFDTQIGAGIVGGYVSRFEDQATQAGAIIVRVLNGVPPGEIPIATATRVPMVDWRQIGRWNVDERKLPSETVVRFREPTAWDKYWREISIGFAIFLIQAGLNAALLIERRSRLRMAAALEETQKQIRLAARAAKLSTWMWDVARDKISVMTARRRATEHPIAFEQILESAYPADRDALERAVRTALETGEEIDVEYRVTGADRNLRWISLRGRTEKNDRQKMLGVAIDVTERKRAELRAVEDQNALRHMTRVSMLGQLSASIAHQLNQPLAAILGNAEAAQKMLTRDRVDLAELREICADIVTADNRAAEVIRRLGALYKRGDMKMEPVDLNALIRETLDLLRGEMLIRHVTPITELARSLPRVDGGSIQLQQVLLNLVINAADAMSEKKVEERRLTIRTALVGAEVRLCVIDNGCGIAPDDLPKVFDAFWSTKSGGMGIGLAICQSIVAAHHGRITASNNPNGGATFCISLPVKART
jgi:C4-dicarboxylate-specific signal transduction histidine kinase/ABC-type uncharacterized transport system substrate-binding protein